MGSEGWGVAAPGDGLVAFGQSRYLGLTAKPSQKCPRERALEGGEAIPLGRWGSPVAFEFMPP